MDQILIFLIVIFILELIYFKIADKYNIIDHPNHRSSHTKITIRGGGIIFPVALLASCFYFGSPYMYFLIGLLLISAISFIDDIEPVSNRIRTVFHLIAVTLLFYQLSLYGLQFHWIFLGFIFVIGTINAINFMDGINGITGGFGFISALTLIYINKYVAFTDERYLISLVIALTVFNFFNFRKKAKCFAGDVGSVSLGFILLFFLLQLIIKTNNFNYLLLFIVYGLDTSTTILFRLIKKENIFKAHRQHFYQFLANEKKISHLVVAALYTIIQAVINISLIIFSLTTFKSLAILGVISLLIFILIRIYFEGYTRLFKVNNNTL